MARQASVSPTHWNTIWTSTVAKEKAIQRRAGMWDMEQCRARLKERDSLDKFLHETKQKRPEDKYIRPVASSHEFGWEQKPLVKENPRFARNRFRRRMHDVTQYGESYIQMVHASPHDRRGGARQ